MLRNRLLAATAALALASSQVSPGFALSGTQIRQQNANPVPNPDGYSAQQLLGMGAPSLGAGTTFGGDIAAGQSFVSTAIANLQAYIIGLLGGKLSHVANNATLAGLTIYTVQVRVDATGVEYADSGTSCTAPDGGSQIQPTSGHCWTLLPNSGKITPSVFGALGTSNGTSGNGNDDTSALQTWLNYGASAHVRLTLSALPNARQWRATASLIMNGVEVDGDYCTTPADVTRFAPWAGSVFFFDHAGQGIQALTGENVLQNLCTFRAQPDPTLATNATFTPGNFDFDIYADTDLDIRDVIVIDPTKAVYGHTGRFWIRNLKGHPLSVGLKTYGLLDTAKWRDIHWWPYSAGNASNVFAWQYANLISFDLARMDNAQLDAISSIIQSTCFKFSANPSSTSPFQGAANKIRVNGADCDGIGSGWGIYVDPSVSSATGVLTAAFTNFTTQTSNAPGNSPYGGGGLDVEGSGSTLEFAGNFQSTFAGGNAVAVNGTGNDVRFANPYIQDWGMVNTSFPAFTVTAGNHVSYGFDWPHFDFALNSDRTYYGGSAYTIASGGKLSFPAGTGTLHAIDVTDGSMVDALQIGGMQTLTQAGPASAIFVNAGGSTDSGCMSATPSGKVGLCYSTDSATYAAFNNTGHAVVLAHQDQRAWPVN